MTACDTAATSAARSTCSAAITKVTPATSRRTRKTPPKSEPPGICSKSAGIVTTSPPMTRRRAHRREGRVMETRLGKLPAGFMGGVAVTAILAVACGSPESAEEASPPPLEVIEATFPAPTFHHIHINSVDPVRSIEWYSDYWPQGEATTHAGFPAFYDDIYLLYTQVDTQAPGGFDRELQRSEPQSGFWTFGSTFAGPNTDAFRERVREFDPEAFEFVTLYGGLDGSHTAPHSLGLPMGDALLRASSITERAEEEADDPRPPATSGLDFAYLVDPDGMLVEVTAGQNDSFPRHTHFWAEHPLCTANWHVAHLGARVPENQNTFSSEFNFGEEGWDPCEVPTGEVTFPTY